MRSKFKLGDRVRYIGKERAGYPIPGKEYNVIDEPSYRKIVGGYRVAEGYDIYGGYEYRLVSASGNNDPNKYSMIEEKYLVLVNPSRIIYG